MSNLINISNHTNAQAILRACGNPDIPTFIQYEGINPFLVRDGAAYTFNKGRVLVTNGQEKTEEEWLMASKILGYREGPKVEVMVVKVKSCWRTGRVVGTAKVKTL